MKLATLTLNPALDRTMFFPSFAAGRLNRADGTRTDAGSKGINVSRVMKILGVEATALGFSGGANGRTLETLLGREGIAHDFTQTAAETRMNIKLIDRSTGAGTEANEAGGPVTAEEIDALERALARHISAGLTHLAAGGSLPRGMEPSCYARLCRTLREAGARAVIDCDGEALALAVRERPYLIKPNDYELSLLTGERIDSRGRAAAESRKIAAAYGCVVACTLGGDGAVAAFPDGTAFSAVPPEVRLMGFAGAGDTFLSVFLYHLEGSAPPGEALRRGVAAATAKVELPGTALPDRAGLEKYVTATIVETI